ncbi:hypothetical protein ACR6C2_17010 [Streptomyces sp. INA 01156]
MPVPSTRTLIEQANGQASFVEACDNCAEFLMDSEGLAFMGYRYIDITSDVRTGA